MANSWIKLFEKWKLIITYNKPAISLPILFKSKNENIFKTTNQPKKKKKDREKEKVPSGGNRAPDHRCKGSSLYLLRHTTKGELNCKINYF